MYLQKDEFGNVVEMPEDFYAMIGCGLPLSKWLSQSHPGFADSTPPEIRSNNFMKFINKKYCLLYEALSLYMSVGSKDLRDEPYVIENYTPTTDCSGIFQRWFIFKEDNNGTTYRIIDDSGPLHMQF